MTESLNSANYKARSLSILLLIHSFNKSWATSTLYWGHSSDEKARRLLKLGGGAGWTGSRELMT